MMNGAGNWCFDLSMGAQIQRASAAIPTEDLAVFLDGDDTDGLLNATRTDGVAFNDWLNKGALGGTFSNALPASQPLFTVGLLNGKSGASFSGDYLTSSLPASSFTFMHDGSGSTIYIVIKTPSSGTRSILTTADVTGVPGFGFRYTTSARVNYYVGQGVLTIGVTSAASAINLGLFDILSASLDVDDTPDATVQANGSSIITGTNTNGFSSSDPQTSLVLGATGAGSTALTGDVLCVLVYSVSHSPARKAEIAAAISAKYGVTFPA